MNEDSDQVEATMAPKSSFRPEKVLTNSENMIAVILSILAGFLILGGLIWVLFQFAGSSTIRTEVVMGITAILGVTVVGLLLFIMATAFSVLKMTDRRQALGLPEGSIRALIALFLIMIFLIFSIFLFRAVGFGFYGPEIANLTSSEVASIADRIGSIRVNGDGTYNVQLFVPLTSEGNQLALQLLTILGTLVTAVSAFYFGTTSAREGRLSTNVSDEPLGQADLKMLSVERVEPEAAPKGTDLFLTVFGQNFDAPSAVRLIRGPEVISARDISGTSSEIRCKVQLDREPDGPWNVIVINRSGQAYELTDGFRIVEVA